jgi:hypothetical protein
MDLTPALRSIHTNLLSGEGASLRRRRMITTKLTGGNGAQPGVLHPPFNFPLVKNTNGKHNKKAIEKYEEFLDIWKNADPGIPEVEDARGRLQKLRTTS